VDVADPYLLWAARSHVARLFLVRLCRLHAAIANASFWARVRPVDPAVGLDVVV